MKQSAPNPEAGKASHRAMSARWRQRWHHWRSLSLRDAWWELLNLWESHRGFRRLTYAILALAVVGAGVRYAAYPRWQRHNAVKIARQWLDAGKLHQAARAIQEALDADPDNPDLWPLAAECARLSKDTDRTLYADQEAVRVAPANADLRFMWASDALLANQIETAQRVLGEVPAESLDRSAWGQRLAGEIARRTGRYDDARQYFLKAIGIEGALPVNAVPLGLVMLTHGNSADQDRGREILQQWAGDPTWGSVSLRALLGDALKRNDHPAMLRWGNALRVHPRCTVGDLPNCLLALSRADETTFRQVLSQLETKYAASAADAAQLLGWLNQIGRAQEALTWSRTLPDATTRQPPVVVMVAESLRQTGDWQALQDWTHTGDWGSNIDLIRLAYGLLAARRGQQTGLADELWQSLQTRAAENGGRALFAADNLYAWGLEDEATTLLWKASAQAGVAYQALGTLARHYQVKRDADGQYRAFRQLHSLRAQDPAIANNYAFFAALTGKVQPAIETLARENHEQDPGNGTFCATYAFVLLMQRRPAEAMAVIRPVAPHWQQSPAVAFAYGLALAQTGDKDQARRILNTLNPNALTRTEVELILSALN